MMQEKIRSVLGKYLTIPQDETLCSEANLYQYGLKSLSTVQLMMELEEEFEVEFTSDLLQRATFGSIKNLSDALQKLQTQAQAQAHQGVL
jgi:acyl carrier protein